jgi:hypothetical protein
MSQWRKSKPSAWQRALAARARGAVPDPEDLVEARERARPGGDPAWVRQVAAKITGAAAPEPEQEVKPMSEYERRLRQRLGAPVDDGPSDAA